MISSLCKRKKVSLLWISLWFRIRNYKTRWISWTIRDLHLDKFPDSSHFQCWKSLQDWSRLNLRISCNHNVVDQRSGSDQISGRSYEIAVNERTWWPWFWDTWDEGSVCIEKDHTSEEELISERITFKKTTNFYEEGKLLVWSINHFRVSDAQDAALWALRSFQYFLRRRWHSGFRCQMGQDLLSVCEVSKENVLKSLYKLKVRDSVQLQTILAMY